MATLNDAVVTAAVIASQASVPLEDASFLRAVLEAIPVFVVRLDPEQRIRYINHLRSGVRLDQVIGRPVRELIAPEDFERFRAAMERSLTTGERCGYLAKGSRAVTRGGAAHYECHTVPIDNGDGRQAVCIIATDMSEHLARADALEESEAKLRIAVEATGIGLFTWYAATDRLEWNQRLADMVGSRPTTAREYVERLVHPEDRARMLGAIESAAAGHLQLLEHRIIRADGEIRWMLPCGSVTRDEHGRMRMVGGLLDVTARRMTEEHLRKAQKLDAVGSLTAGITHNFNNMLAVIVPALDVLSKNAPPEQRAMVADAVHAARRAKELVTQLMTFAGQRRTPSAAPQDVGAIVERAISLCRRTFAGTVRIDSPSEQRVLEVTCDSTAIEQVVVNLLINARDAVLEAQGVEPLITVELSEAEATPPEMPSRGLARYVRITVKDNGVGMDEAVKQRLFEPFFTTKGPGRGTGLGLATSYGVLRDHGGFMTFESQRGAGTTAAVFLPMRNADSSPQSSGVDA